MQRQRLLEMDSKSLTILIYFACGIHFAKHAHALNNGLALTPPMGFNNWERFRCNIDCANDPDNCVSEKLFMSIADAFVKHGYKDAGYQYINIDDCWMAKKRDNVTGKLIPDPDRFPSGIAALAAYVHALGLKLGIYEDIGTLTCGGFPGTQGYEELDAKTFAEWNVDLLKLDGCYRDPRSFDQIYPLMGLYLNATGRPILYSCSWPAYQVDMKIPPDYAAIGKYCNIWRNYGDIQDSFDSILDIIQWYGDNQKSLRPASRPGQWNDPDMVIVGDFGLSLDQARSQFAIWAILAAPLFLSADVRKMDPQYQEIVLNRDVIAVNQDALGIMGERLNNVSTHSQFEIWRRPVLPVAPHGGADNGPSTSYALVFFNRRTDGTPLPYQTKLSALGLLDTTGYHVQDLFTGADYNLMYPNDVLKLRVDPGGAVVMLKATVQGAGIEAGGLTSAEVEKIRREHGAKKNRLRSNFGYRDDVRDGVDVTQLAGWGNGVKLPSTKLLGHGRTVEPRRMVDRTVIIEKHETFIFNVPAEEPLDNSFIQHQHTRIAYLCEITPLLKQINWLLICIFIVLCACTMLSLLKRRRSRQHVAQWHRLRNEELCREATLSNVVVSSCRLDDTAKPVISSFH